MNGSWTATLTRRVSRRRALLSAATLGAGALAVSTLGCGGGGDDGGGHGLTTLPSETTKQAVRGGTMQAYIASEGLNFDAPTGTAQVTAHAILAYSRLVRVKLGTAENPPDGSVEPDAASSFEWSPDGMQLTFKLRQGMKFEARPPVNGRTVNSADVKYSWERFAAGNPSRGDWVTSANPEAPIERLEFPDASTVVVKMAFPLAAMLGRFRSSIYVVPVEAEDKFDIKQEMRGSGPWVLTKYERSAGWEYKRNPNWFQAAERPYLDGINFALMSEPAVRVAQFRARRLWYFTPTEGDDVTTLKKDDPQMSLVGFNPRKSGGQGGYQITLSKLANSPLQQDVRLRHAISMLIDRDAWMDAFYNVSRNEQQGLPMEAAWNSGISCTPSSGWTPKRTSWATTPSGTSTTRRRPPSCCAPPASSASSRSSPTPRAALPRRPPRARWRSSPRCFRRVATSSSR